MSMRPAVLVAMLLLAAGLAGCADVLPEDPTPSTSTLPPATATTPSPTMPSTPRATPTPAPSWMPGAAPVDDAGRGADAPDARAFAWLVESGVTRGDLRPASSDREDWYALVAPTTTSLRILLSARADTMYVTLVSAEGAVAHEGWAPGGAFELTAPAGTWRLGLGAGLGADVVAPYAFDASLRQDDAGSARDAPMVGTPVEPGSHTGTLVFHEGDQEDWYNVTVPEGHVLRVTFRITDGSGTFYGGIHTLPGRALVENELVGRNWEVALTAGAGEWHVVAGNHESVSGSLAYLMTIRLVRVEPQDDAGSGADAPQEGLPIDLGTFSARVVYDDGEDPEDWYVLPIVPEGWTLSVTFEGPSPGLWGGIHHLDGRLVMNKRSLGGVQTLTASAGEYRLGFGDHEASAGAVEYVFTLEMVAQ